MYVYRSIEGAWSEAQILVASDVTVRGRFGLFLSMDGNKLVVGGGGALSTG